MFRLPFHVLCVCWAVTLAARDEDASSNAASESLSLVDSMKALKKHLTPPTEYRDELKRALLFSSMNEDGKTETALNDLISKYPDRPEAVVELGRMHGRLGDDELAETLYMKALKVNLQVPREVLQSDKETGAKLHPDAWIALGRLYVNQKKLEAATRAFTKVLKRIHPRHPAALHGLARVQAMGGRPHAKKLRDAIEAAEEGEGEGEEEGEVHAFFLGSEDPKSTSILGRIDLALQLVKEGRGDTERGRDLVKAILEPVTPQEISAHVKVGNLLLFGRAFKEIGLCSRAIEFFDFLRGETWRVPGEKTEALLEKGRCWEKEGEKERAKETYRQVIEESQAKEEGEEEDDGGIPRDELKILRMAKAEMLLGALGMGIGMMNFGQEFACGLGESLLFGSTAVSHVKRAKDLFEIAASRLHREKRKDAEALRSRAVSILEHCEEERKEIAAWSEIAEKVRSSAEKVPRSLSGEGDQFETSDCVERLREWVRGGEWGGRPVASVSESDTATLSRERFERDHVSGGVPVVFRSGGASRGRGLQSEFWDLSVWERENLERALNGTLANMTVRVAVSESGRFDGPENGTLWGLGDERLPSGAIPEVFVRPATGFMRLGDFLSIAGRPGVGDSMYTEYLDVSQYLGEHTARALFPLPSYISSKTSQFDREINISSGRGTGEMNEEGGYRGLLKLRQTNLWVGAAPLEEDETETPALAPREEEETGVSLQRQRRKGKRRRSLQSPLHYDDYENLLCQMRGFKRLVLFSPPDIHKLYYTGRVKGTLKYEWPGNFTRIPIPKDKKKRGHRAVFGGSVSAFFPDFQRHPLARDANPRRTFLAPGDCLFMPAFWHHEVLSDMDERDGLNVAVNFWFSNLTAFSEETEIINRKPEQTVTVSVPSSTGQKGPGTEKRTERHEEL